MEATKQEFSPSDLGITIYGNDGFLDWQKT